MLETVRNALKIKELRQRLIFTMLMLVVHRIGSHVPVPGINPEVLADFFQEDTLFGFYNVIAGGALSDFTIFAMGIMPYINASIIMQLLTVVIPKFKEWSEEGPRDVRKWSRSSAMALLFGFITGCGDDVQPHEASNYRSQVDILPCYYYFLDGRNCFSHVAGRINYGKGIGNGYL